jgi:hypothetical protein
MNEPIRWCSRACASAHEVRRVWDGVQRSGLSVLRKRLGEAGTYVVGAVAR